MLSPAYVFFGLVTSLIVSLIAWKIKIINKHTSFLFLNFGFYQHFLKVIFLSFIESVLIAIKLAMGSKDIKPHFHSIPIKKLTNNEIVLLTNTINLMAGLVCVGFKDKNIIICALNEKYFKKLNITKICDNLYKIYDSRLV